MTGDLILRVISKLLMPFMLMFALYVQFHGDFGPGGGFQAGVIAAAMVIFYAIVFGLPATRRLLPDRLVETMIGLGVLVYAGVGIAGLLLGGNFLDYFVLDARSGSRPAPRHLLGRDRRRDHRLRGDAQGVLHVRRAQARRA